MRVLLHFEIYHRLLADSLLNILLLFVPFRLKGVFDEDVGKFFAFMEEALRLEFCPSVTAFALHDASII